MRKFAIKKAASEKGGPDGSPRGESKGGWFREHWRLIFLFVTVVAAFLLRFVFAYGISAGDNYALSGGNSANTNLRVITEILAGTFDPANQAALNYPIGSVSVHGPFFDYLMAGIASVGTLFGVSDATAAAGALAWTAPIFGALTCIPVYFIGKKLSKENETVGVLSALFYAFFALTVMTTPFSNGTVFPLVCLLFASMVYALIRAFEEADKAGAEGFTSAFSEKAVLKHTLIASVLFALIALSWTDYRVIVLASAILMFVGFCARRITRKEIGAQAGIMSVILLFGTVVAAAYYIPTGMWDPVFSGACVLAVLTAVFSIAAAAFERKSWVLTIPTFVVAIVIASAVLMFFAPDLLDAMIRGNNVYEGPLMKALVDNSFRTGIGAMSAYYGWFTVWMPFVLGSWMVYRYRKDGGSRVYGLSTLWLFACFLVGWFSSDYAIVAGAAFGVASAVIVYRLVKAVNLRKYFASLRGNGIKGGAKKALKFFPLVTIVGIVVLIIVPNAVYAVDAATPTNDEKAGYFGGVGYTISTTDSSLMDSMWNSYGGGEKSGAVISWFGYSDEAVSKGGFDSVTDVNGGGTAAMARTMLGSSSGDAIAAMALRLILAGDVGDFRSDIESAGLDYGTVSGFIADQSTAVDYVKDNPDRFPGISADLTRENAVYLAVTDYMEQTISDSQIAAFYDDVRKTSGKSITYVEVDGGMIPMYAGDNSSFSTIAYFGDYNRGTYGEPSEFYTVSKSNRYCTYTNAMYETFLWKALLGVSASDAGQTSSTALLNKLALSDGTVKAVPGLGLSNFDVSYWHVRYNADDDATAASGGWEDMDAYAAIAKQKKDGGVINYLSSVVVLEYKGAASAGHDRKIGTVTYTSATGSAPAAGIKVAVFEESDASGATGYVQRSTDVTRADGSFAVDVPSSGETQYYVVFYSGSDSTRGGTPIETHYNDVPSSVSLDDTSVSGALSVGSDGGTYPADGYVTLTGNTGKMVYQASLIKGAFSFQHILPDTYSAAVYNDAGTQIGSATLTVTAGDSGGVQLPLTTGTISVSAKDQYSRNIPNGKFVAVNNDTGFETEGEVKDGIGSAIVPTGTYTVYLTDGYVSVSTATSSVTSDKTRSVTLTGYEAATLTVNGLPPGVAASVMSDGYSTVANPTAQIPAVGGVISAYTVYAVSGNTVYYGVSSGTSATVASSAGCAVSGTLMNGGKTATGTVALIKSTGETFVFGTDADGAFSATVPAGSYRINAYDGKESVYLGATTVSADVEMGTVSLVDGHSVTARLVYTTRMSSSSTRGVPYADAVGTLAYNGTDYSLTVKTNSEGKAVFWIPDNTEITVTIPAFETDVFVVKSDLTNKSTSGSTNTTIPTWTIAGKQADDAEKYVKTVNVSADYNGVALTAYSDKTLTYTVGTSAITVIPGQYTAKLSSGGHFFDGTVYVYPGSNHIDMDAIESATLNVVKSGSDVVEVTAVANADGEAGTSKDVDGTYYLKAGYDYLVTATGSDGKIAYYSISNASGTYSADMTNKYDKAEISGHVGVNANGKLSITAAGATLSVDIDGGKYSATVPAGHALTMSATVTATDSGTKYKMSGSASMTAASVVDGAVCNFSVVTDSEEPESADIVTVVGGSFANGRGTMDLSITNKGSRPASYVIVGGSNFALEKAYPVTIAAGATVSQNVSGYYNAETVGYGDPGMNVVIRSVSGTAVATVKVPSSLFSGSGSEAVSVETAGAEGASSDSVNGYAYKYAITVDNPNGNALGATISATANGGGWGIFVTDSTGYGIYGPGHAFDVNGFGKTTLYVMLVNSDGSGKPVPGVTVDVSISGASSVTSGSLSVGGTVATGNLTASEADTEMTDSSVSGGGAENDAKEISATFWALCVLCVLALLMLVWGASKRGVFPRKK